MSDQHQNTTDSPQKSNQHGGMKFCLMLDGTRFSYCKIEEGRKVGDPYCWELQPGQKSLLPRGIFHFIHKKLRSSAANGGKKDRWDRIIRALGLLAFEFGCEPRAPEDHSAIIWDKNNTTFLSIVLSNDPQAEHPYLGLLNFRVDETGYLWPRKNGVRP